MEALSGARQLTGDPGATPITPAARRVVTVEHAGSVADLHGRDPFAQAPDARPDAIPDAVDAIQVWWCRPTDTAIVLGSRQRPGLLDEQRCADAGISIAQRRSGGGLVVIEPSSTIWVDVVAAAGVLPDDPRGAMVTVGEWWVAALQRAGAARSVAVPPLAVHRGGMVETAWSTLVCFDGIGPGEVLEVGRASSRATKLVGLSQRRTRRGVRIQGLLYRAACRVDPSALLVPGLAGVPAEPLAPPHWIDADPDQVVAGLATEATGWIEAGR